MLLEYLLLLLSLLLLLLLLLCLLLLLLLLLSLLLLLLMLLLLLLLLFKEALENFSLIPQFFSNKLRFLYHRSVYLYSDCMLNLTCNFNLRGYSTPWTLFLKTLCIFSKHKATLDKLSY